MISDKDNLSTGDGGAKTTKVPRCSDRIARLYRSKERMYEAALNVKKGAADRRTAIAAMVTIHLGDTSATGLRCERFLRGAVCRWLQGSRSQATWRTYLASLGRWIAATDKRSLSAQVDTDSSEVMAYLFALEKGGASQRTIALRRDCLRAWFGWLVEEDLLARSPIRREATRAFRVDHTAVTKGSGLRQALTQDEAQRVVAWALTEASPAAGFSVLLELVAGLRSHEVAALEARHLVEHLASNIAGDDNPSSIWQLTVPGKGNKQRPVTLEPIVIAAYQRYLAADRRHGARGALLRRRGGGHYSPRSIQGFAKEAAAAIGRRDEISSHDFRASCATILRERGAGLSEVQTLLGHSSPVLTERCYIRRPKALTTTTGLTIPSIQSQPQKGTA